MDRRTFLQRSALGVAGLGLMSKAFSATEVVEYKPFRNAVQYGHLPATLPEEEKFALVKTLGFDGVEMGPMSDLAAAKQRGAVARALGTPVHSIIYGGWGAPMSHPDSSVVAKGKAEIEMALRTAQAVGADTVLLVPAVVNENVRYEEAWKRSQENIRPLLPLAEELGVVIAVENVWNKFLLSPLEFAQYVDEFDSPWLQAYFDIGNVVIFGYPEDWIRTLGKRIHRVHVKDFKRKGFQWSKLPYEGDVNWAAVRMALAEVGYEGWVTEEFPKGDEAYMKELAQRMTCFGRGRSAI